MHYQFVRMCKGFFFPAVFLEAYDSVRREVLYNIPIKFGVPMKLVRLIKMCLNEDDNK
jgi:hypothetical protein